MPTGSMLILAHKTLGHGMYVFAAIAVGAATDFSSSITLGSIIITVAILGFAGVFTVRSKIAGVWRDEAEGQRAAKERVEDLLAAEKESRGLFDRQQQELRHELKGQVAALAAQLRVMEAKTDLTAALDAIKQMNEHTTGVIAKAMQHGSELSERRDEQTHHLLEEIRDKLPSEPIAVHDITTE